MIQRLLKQIKKNLITFFPIIFIFLIFLLIYRSLLFNIKTNLLDWNDSPYYIWTIYQNINHFKNLDFVNFSNSNSFYPLANTLFLSDLLIPQSLIAFFYSFFISSKIIVFNLTFFTQILLNISCAYILSRALFKKNSARFLATLTLSLSNYFFSQVGHLQMISYWPSLLILYFLLKDELNKIKLKSLILIALLLVIQFYASVYLTIFLITIIIVYYLIHFIYQGLNFKYIKQLSLISLIFLLFAGGALYQYKLTQQKYQIHIQYQEYVHYAAYLSDYFFFSHQSLFSLLIKFWNQKNPHLLGEKVVNPSLSLSVLAFLGVYQLFFLTKHQAKKNQSIKNLLFFFLILIGFILSLGPRLVFNQSIKIPLPYYLLFRLPLFEPIRATSRWYFLFFLGIWYFAIKYLDQLKINNKQIKILIIFIALFYLIEVIPINIKTEKKDYYPSVYNEINNQCKQNKLVLLEFPMSLSHKYQEINVKDYLQYKTAMLIASLENNCHLVNGYSGYTPQPILDLENNLETYIDEQNYLAFKNMLINKQIDLLKINKSGFFHPAANNFYQWLAIQSGIKLIYDDDNYLVLKLENY